jgi:outer membrane protein TolC
MRPVSLRLIVFLSICFPLTAQGAGFTVEDAVSLALQNNLDIRMAEQDARLARAEFGAAWADLFMPSLQVTGNFSYTDPAASAAAYNDAYAFGLMVKRDLFSGGKFWFAREAKRLTLENAELKLNEKKKETIRATRTGFYGLLLLKEKLRIAVEYDKSLKYRLESARVNYANGAISRLDYLKEQVKYKNNQPQLLKARNDYATARVDFSAFIGWTDPEPAEPAGDILESLKLAPKNRDEAAVTAAALEKDLSLRTLDYEASVAEANRAALWAARWPALSGSFNYKFDYKNDGGGGRAFLPGWTASLSLVVPLDPWVPGVSRLSYQLEGAEALAEKKRLQREQIEAAVKGRIKALYLHAALAEESIAGQKENVAQAKLVQETAQRQYREGSLSALDLNDAELAYSQALANYWQALYDRYADVLQLNDYLE